MSKDVPTLHQVPPAPDSEKEDEGSRLQQALGDRYQILDYISRGAMGAVYAAREPGLRRSVAIKVISLPSGAKHSSDQDVRFSVEMNAMASIRDPNVIRIYSQGGDESKGELRYIVMEHLMGMPLVDYIAERGEVETRFPIKDGSIRTFRALTWAQALPLIRQIASGLRAIHAAGILHRDLKPGNIVIDIDSARKERAVIIDLGLAKMTPEEVVKDERTVLDLRTDTLAGQLFGTPQFMAPEQASGRLIRPTEYRVDTYALGGVFYQMLAGFVAYEDTLLREFTDEELDGNVMALISVHPRKLPLLPISKVQASTPAWADAFIAKALERDPSKRFQTVDEFLEALDKGIANEEHERQAKAARRHLLPLMVAISVVVFVLMGTLLYVLEVRRSPISVDAGRVMVNRRAVVATDIPVIPGDAGAVTDGGFADQAPVLPHDAGRRRPVRRAPRPCVETINLVTGTIIPCFNQ